MRKFNINNVLVPVDLTQTKVLFQRHSGHIVMFIIISVVLLQIMDQLVKELVNYLTII